MASPDVITVEEYLEPISEEAPCGENIRDDSTLYYKVRDPRSAASDAERKQEASEDESSEPPDWYPVQNLGLEALRDSTKDLEVAAWVVEALLRREKFAGLRDGFRLIRGLIENFWDDIYPPEEDEGVLDKVAPLAGLNGEDADGVLIAPIRRVPLTEMGSFGELAWHHYKRAQDLSIIEDEERLEELKSAGHVTLEQFQLAAKDSGPQFYRDLLDDLTAASEEFAQICALLDERCGDNAPPSSQIRNALLETLETVQQISKDILPPEESEEEEDELEEDGGGEEGAEGKAAGNPKKAARSMAQGDVQTRDEAFKALDKIAEFFRKTEPHSPISYALEQAVRWGKMDLPGLMQELIVDDGTRQQFYSLTGIKQEQDDGY